MFVRFRQTGLPKPHVHSEIGARAGVRMDKVELRSGCENRWCTESA
jgi:hypothetical protein